MSHDSSFDERLSAYLDGQLSPAERAEVESLLQKRPELVQSLDQMRQLGEGIRALPRLELGPEFAGKVVAAIEAQQVRPTRGFRPPLLALAAAAAAVAALVLAMVWIGGQNDDVAAPPALSPAEQAVASVLAQADEGEAVIVRLQLTKDAVRGKALDAALAAHGIAAAPASAANPAANESAAAYKSRAKEDLQPGNAADVLFIEADQEKLQKALAELALSPDGTPVISSGGVVPSTAGGIDRVPKVEGETGTNHDVLKPDGRNYAQHLPPRGFPLLKPSGSSDTPATCPPAASSRPKRVLVVVEVVP